VKHQGPRPQLLGSVRVEGSFRCVLSSSRRFFSSAYGCFVSRTCATRCDREIRSWIRSMNPSRKWEFRTKPSKASCCDPSRRKMTLVPFCFCRAGRCC